MINEHSEQLVTGKGPKRIVIRARHRPKQWITLPINREAAEREALEFEKAKKKFEGTTPQGREIIRKVLATTRQKLYGTSGRPSAPEQAQAPQWERVTLVSSVNNTTPKSGESSTPPDHLAGLPQILTVVDPDGPQKEQQAQRLEPSGEVNQPKEPAARKLEEPEKKFAGTTPQGQGILGKFMAKVQSVLFPRSSAGRDAQPNSVPHYAAQQLDKVKSNGPGEPTAELSQLNGPEPKYLETKTADPPLKPQAQPVAATPTQKPPVVTPTAVTPATVAPATVAPATVAPATVTPTNPAQQPIATRPRNVVEGCSMAEARRLGLVR